MAVCTFKVGFWSSNKPEEEDEPHSGAKYLIICVDVISSFINSTIIICNTFSTRLQGRGNRSGCTQQILWELWNIKPSILAHYIFCLFFYPQLCRNCLLKYRNVKLLPWGEGNNWLLVLTKNQKYCRKGAGLARKGLFIGLALLTSTERAVLHTDGSQ